MFKIRQARLVGYTGLQEITVNSQGIITAISPCGGPLATKDNYTIVDVQGDWLSLGGIDLQINGGLGVAFTELKDPQELAAISNYLWEQGVDGYLPTLITTAEANLQHSLKIIADYLPQQPPQTAQILGVHLEGPCLNPSKRGAHPKEYLRPLTLDTLKRLLGDYQEIITIITLAPELDTTGTVIPYLVSQGIRVSMGHSLATAKEAKQAFQLGASLVTHAFNAMPSLHHRDPGLLGEAMLNPQVYCGLIADGEHVCPTMISILLKASDYSQGVFLVSDALAPMGLPAGSYPWDNRTITITEGTAKLEDGTLAGTTLPLLEGVKNLVNWGICDVEEAIALATVAPRKAIGLVGQFGQLLHWSWQPQSSQLIWDRLDLTKFSSRKR